jgi:arylsulfatase A-like enzyme
MAATLGGYEESGFKTRIMTSRASLVFTFLAALLVSPGSLAAGRPPNIDRLARDGAKFTGDNGGLSTGEGSPTSNLPLRGGKGWIYEGGIRELLIVRWSAVVKAGGIVSTPVNSPDFLLSLLEAVGAKPRSGQTLDGVSPNRSRCSS